MIDLVIVREIVIVHPFLSVLPLIIAIILFVNGFYRQLTIKPFNKKAYRFAIVILLLAQLILLCCLYYLTLETVGPLPTSLNYIYLTVNIFSFFAFLQMGLFLIRSKGSFYLGSLFILCATYQILSFVLPRALLFLLQRGFVESTWDEWLGYLGRLLDFLDPCYNFINSVAILGLVLFLNSMKAVKPKDSETVKTI